MSTWLETLSNLGATLETTNGVSRCTHTPNHGKSTHIVPLVHQGIIQVTGPDTDKYLQGQLTCDVDRVRSIGSTLGSHCNIKGHMISLARLIGTETGVMLRLPSDTLMSAHAALAKYIVFSKAEIAIDTDLVGLGIIGPGAATFVERLVQNVPSENEGATHFSGITAVRLDEETFEVWLPMAHAQEHITEWLDIADLAVTNAWEANRINAAEPAVFANTSEAFIPQMTNLQAFEGVSFKKGCYTGQEIVTRLQHRGQLKRPMYRLTASTEEDLKVGDPLFSSEKENIGKVVRISHANMDMYGAVTEGSDTDHVNFLAVAVKDIADANDLRINSTQGPSICIEALPYTLDPAMFEPKHRL